MFPGSSFTKIAMTVKRNNIVPLRQIVACDIFSQLKFPRKTSRPVEAFIYFEHYNNVNRLFTEIQDGML